MISKDPEDRQFYESRQKVQRDEQARLEFAEERGESIGRVRLLQQLLKLTESALEDLRGRSPEELAELESDLQRQLRNLG